MQIMNNIKIYTEFRNIDIIFVLIFPKPMLNELSQMAYLSIYLSIYIYTVVTRYNTMVGGQNLDRVISESCYKIQPSKTRSLFTKMPEFGLCQAMVVCVYTKAFCLPNVTNGPKTRSLYSICDLYF